ncbi:ROK family transcriptional regulator [Actinoplanes derwentensis]|uniref:Sugar kinase of the NBD/HSP70 family, may contain an N-terminal HTH domain n=1 Tax=Actinoplanes derwentensis TaxID=113562 RepID=A0A1H1STZ6_9ACTN|nr:ROK family transcriptional regulator [Actinoplanes derwentensis]GID83209.1 transcriptional regulator [Actinoplanes derwentensis]SDS51452.1 Sugar kinase of the NBD/HSP70 family, may contain an N-terminal HTH domain [Actinoplanes derwentensis]
MTRGTTRTATTKVVTDINRTAVLDTLEQRGPLTRTALREHTGLSPATVDRLCSALLDEGLIERSGVTASQGGRPSTLFRFAGERRVIVAAAIAADGPRGMLVGVDGSIVERAVRPADGDQLDSALDLIAHLLGRAAATGRSSLGVALSVPGVVDAEGRVSNSVELGWQRLAVGSVIEHRFGLPCLVENDANAIAVGEWTQGAGTGTDSLVAVVLGIGVGAGLVSGGQLVRGARSGAGEIGYLLTGRDSLSRLFTRQGDLESRISGDQPTDEVLDYLALAIAALASVFDPEMVILSGRLPEKSIVPALEQRLTGRIPFVPQITAGKLGADAALLGVAELLARRTKGSVYLA